MNDQATAGQSLDDAGLHGISQGTRMGTNALPPADDHTQLLRLIEANQQLQAQLAQILAERETLADRQTRIMSLLGTKSPERLVHDLRNLLNELALLQALVPADDDATCESR